MDQLVVAVNHAAVVRNPTVGVLGDLFYAWVPGPGAIPVKPTPPTK